MASISIKREDEGQNGPAHTTSNRTLAGSSPQYATRRLARFTQCSALRLAVRYRGDAEDSGRNTTCANWRQDALDAPVVVVARSPKAGVAIGRGAAVDTFDVFLSYNQRDLDFVRELHRRLTRDGVHCFFDKVDIDLAENFVLKLELAQKQSRRVVAVLSPEYVQGDWTTAERAAATIADPAARRQRVIPIIRRDVPDADVPLFLQPIQRVVCRTDKEFDDEYPRICQALGGTPRRDPLPPPADRAIMPQISASRPHRWSVLFSSLGDAFSGRVADIWRLHDAVWGTRTAVVTGGTAASVCGLTGVGKSQLALEYAWRFASFYPGGVYWVSAERVSRQEAARQIAAAAGLALRVGAGEEAEWAELCAGLREHPHSLIVLDNFPERSATSGEPPSLSPWLPSVPDVHVLVTSRGGNAGARALVIGLDVLEPAEALALLTRQRAPDCETERNAAAGVAERLGYLPMPLEVAGAYLHRRRDLAFSVYLAVLDKRGAIESLQHMAAEYREPLPTGRGPDILAAFDESWAFLSREARMLLAILARLAPEPVPRGLLQAIAAKLGLSDGDDPLAGAFSRAVEELRDSSLLSLDARATTVKAHRLLLEYSRRREAEVDDTPDPSEACDQVLFDQLRRAHDVHDVASLSDLAVLIPHVEFRLQQPETSTRSEVVDALATCLSTHLRNRGHYAKAKHWAEVALQAALAADGVDDTARSARAISNLATLLSDLGEPDGAIRMLEAAITADEASLGRRHPRVAVLFMNLAAAFRDKGEFERAQSAARKAFDILCAMVPRPSKLVADSLGILGLILNDLGKAEEGKPFLEDALEIDETLFGPDHPAVANHLSTLGTILLGLGDRPGAKACLERAMAIDLAHFGPEHPTVAVDSNNLAVLFIRDRDPAAARLLLERALRIDESIFGHNHQLVAMRLHNLGMAYKAIGDRPSAKPFMEEALRIAENVLGPDHLTTRMFRENLAAL